MNTLGTRSLISSLNTKALRAERLETKLRSTAFRVLRRLCDRTGHLPDSHLVSDKFDPSGMPCAAAGFSDVRKGSLDGRDVPDKPDPSGIPCAAVSSFADIRGRMNAMDVSDKFNLSGRPIASGGFADVWKGSLDGRVVAIKSLRVSRTVETMKDLKVRDQTTTYRPGSLTHRVGLVQRVRPVEGFVASRCSQTPYCR